jgi:selenoprotein W-related protein
MNNYTPAIETLTLIPSSGGRFEVMANDILVFSKKSIGRHAELGEVARLFEEKTGVTAQPFGKK